MNQYEFTISKKEYVNTVYCTARDSAAAYMAISAAYAPEFEIGEKPVSVCKAHRVFAEIDATRA